MNVERIREFVFFIQTVSFSVRRENSDNKNHLFIERVENYVTTKTTHNLDEKQKNINSVMI